MSCLHVLHANKSFQLSVYIVEAIYFFKIHYTKVDLI